ncbi:MAG: hypothetical protein ACREP9_13330, partial [Candidatus Dormibacteraceae bacterium]
MILVHTIVHLTRITAIILIFTLRLLARLGWLLVIVVAKLAMWSMHSKERVLVAVVSAGFGFLLL